MKRSGRVFVLMAALGISCLALADMKSGNCKTTAVKLTPENDKTTAITLQREWDETANGYEWVWDDIHGGFVPGDPLPGDWADRMTVNDPSVWTAAYWLYFELERGKDYVLSFDQDFDNYARFDAALGSPRRALFGKGGSSIKADGMVHYYVRAQDWVTSGPYPDADKVGYYLRIGSKRDTIGVQVPVKFQQRSILEVLPTPPGSLEVPYPLSVLTNGSMVIASAVQNLDKTYYTAYTATLKANVTYVFTGNETDDEEDIVTFALAVPKDQIPGDVAIEEYGSRLTITVREDDYDFTFKAWAYSRVRNMTGESFSWTNSESPAPVPAVIVSAGTFTATLADEDSGKVSATFAVVARLKDDDTTNFTATVSANGVVLEFADDGTGFVTNAQVIATIPYESGFRVTMTDANTVEIDGFVYLENGQTVDAVPFKGALDGSLVSWEESFLRVDPGTMTAAEMGIKSGAFKDEPVNGDRTTLTNLCRWGAAYNVRVPSVGAVTFSDSGDPQGVPAESYLLNCAPSAEDVTAAKKSFEITAFDPATGTVTVAGDKVDGDGYGNGTVEVRTSLTIDGTYDTTVKSGNQLFYRAYLVK